IATSLTGPWWVDSASPAAPVPRPPQPTRAMLMVLLSPAYRPDRPKPAATARPPVAFRASRRVGATVGSLLMGSFRREPVWGGRTTGRGGGGGVGRRGISGELSAAGQAQARGKWVPLAATR